MSYQITPASVEKVKDELNVLINNSANEVYFDTNDPKRLCYLLMQGSSAAQRLKLPKLEEIKANYKFCAESKRVKASKSLLTISSPYLEFPEAKELLDILDTYIKNRDSKVELRFPNAMKSEEVEEWLNDPTKKRAYKWDGKILIIYPFNKKENEEEG